MFFLFFIFTRQHIEAIEALRGTQTFHYVFLIFTRQHIDAIEALRGTTCEPLPAEQWLELARF
jgi:hypothetical protein